MGTALGQNTGFRVSLVRNEVIYPGGLWVIGEGSAGKLGIGSTLNISTPVQVGSLTDWSQISSGYDTTHAVKTDGTLWAWGYNTNGQIGNGTRGVDYSSPVQIGSLTNWKQVSEYTHVMAVKTDGTLWGWGTNSKGELGTGNTTYFSSPVQVGSLTNWSKVSGGSSTTMAIKTDGTLWGWGQNNQGQLGNGTTSYYSSPIQIGSLTNWSDVICSAGTSTQLALKTDGTMWAWGGIATHGELGNGTAGIYYSSPVQIGSLTNWSQIGGNSGIRFAIKTDGTLWAWGYNVEGELGNGTTSYYSSPIQIGSLTTWYKIAGRNQAAAIKTDGTLWAWGPNSSGTLGNGTTIRYSSPIQVGSLSIWGSVFTGLGSIFAIPSSSGRVTYGQDTYSAGSLWGCGYNGSIAPVLGNGTTINYSSPIQIGSLTNWSKVSGSLDGAVAVKTDGTLWSWGRNQHGQLGNGTTITYSSPIQIGALTNWSKVSFSKLTGFFLAIKTDGTLWGCGYNTQGQLGNSVTDKYSSPIQIGSLTNWSDVSSGAYHSMAIKTDGTLWAWSYNVNGELGIGNRINYSSPVQVGLLTNWSKVSAGACTLAIKTDGTLWGWGENDHGAIGNSTFTKYSSPVQIGALTNWSQVSVGFKHSAAIKTDGTLWTWGRNDKGQLATTPITPNVNGQGFSSPVQIGSLTNWSQVACGYDHTLSYKNDGTLWSWGGNSDYGQLGNGTTVSYSSPIQVGSLTNWGYVSAGRSVSYFIPSSTLVVGRQQDLGQRYVSKDYLLDVYPNIASATGARTAPGLWTWGRNDYGDLGNGTLINYSSPIQIGSLTNWKQIESEYYGVMAVKTNGTLWGWGRNNWGHIGNGTVIDYSSPIQVGSLTNWKQVAVGWATTVAIKTDGTLWTCGWNGATGILGNGTTINYISPIQIGSLTNWKQASVGGDRFCAAVKTDGTLWTWGSNAFGQLGRGVSNWYSSPVQVGSLTNWKYVNCEFYNMAAIKTDGTLWTCGYNRYGQLGDGTTVNKSSPIQVGLLTNWKQVSVGQAHMSAIKTDGTLWTWGWGGNGNLGNGALSNYSSPIQIGLLTNWSKVACFKDATYATAAIKTDGTLWTWGFNGQGQLGNGTTIQYSSPIQIGSLSNWKQVSGGVDVIATISDGYY